MDVPYKKLLLKLIISTILIFTITNITYANDKVSSGYFYDKSYEGTAGYCAVITPELTKVSDEFSAKLNITPPIRSNQYYANPKTPEQKQNYTQEKNDSFSKMASKKTELKTNTPAKKNLFKNLYSYIDQ
tara:strand:- start:11435 stop:11824 length:390 start_codon:yes stop_codon:yes gene_type:complete